jgi:hypothetical protein
VDRDLPPDDADELTWLLFHQDNVLTRRQALHHLTRKSTVTRRAAASRVAKRRGMGLD